jgi:hypothetical protein
MTDFFFISFPRLLSPPEIIKVKNYVADASIISKTIV